MGSDQDFKYVLQDFSNVYIGARLTYRQLTEQSDTPQRLSSAIFLYVFQNGLQDVRICDHLMQIEEKTMPCMIYMQLKAQIKVVEPVKKINKKGQESIEYKTRTYTAGEFIKNKELRQRIQPEQISEISFKKLHLMSLSV